MFRDSDIIVRTEAGARTCNNPHEASDLPRKLRTILLAIDNETPLSLYRKYLRSFGDIDALFDCLYEAGLITAAGLERRTEPSQPAEQARTESASVPRPSAALQVAGEQSDKTIAGGADRGMDSHRFEEMMGRIISEVDTRLGADGLNLMMTLESLESYAELQERMQDLERIAREIASGQKAYKMIEKIIREAA